MKNLCTENISSSIYHSSAHLFFYSVFQNSEDWMGSLGKHYLTTYSHSWDTGNQVGT
mgnify:FL=1